MGIDSNCDDGKTNLTLDWPDPGTLLCSSRNSKYPLYGKLQNKKECINLPANYHDHYSPDHYCMYTEVTYDHVIPVIEGHRPVWPIFGEYYHVPRQRYLHSIEHGSVVMLYHPCTAEHLVARLRSLVTRCVRKYVISREPLLDPNYPIALAAWGCRLQMNSVNDTEVIEFIKTYALHGPEKLYEREGQYNYTLFRTAFYPPGMLENPSKPAQGQKMTVCPAQSLEGHFQVYDKDHEVPIGTDSSKYAHMFAFLDSATINTEQFSED
ncbi:uncharacterized protein LOC111259353 isoform X2 [Varroa jacobsoni]|nr:uncharacterized protein LOC111245934 isoform X2 [Varroa destructor]XP_022687052.1 uncharacterized protein LOC111259353 isoform X2 [Varroa jacobsoni]